MPAIESNTASRDGRRREIDGPATAGVGRPRPSSADARDDCRSLKGFGRSSTQVDIDELRAALKVPADAKGSATQGSPDSDPIDDHLRPATGRAG